MIYYRVHLSTLFHPYYNVIDVGVNISFPSYILQDQRTLFRSTQTEYLRNDLPTRLRGLTISKQE
jgi:hypothetical protein